MQILYTVLQHSPSWRLLRAPGPLPQSLAGGEGKPAGAERCEEALAVQQRPLGPVPGVRSRACLWAGLLLAHEDERGAAWPGQAACSSALFSAVPLAMVFQDLLTNKDDYLRASRALLREIITDEDEDQLPGLRLGLMQERKEPQYLDMESRCAAPSPRCRPSAPAAGPAPCCRPCPRRRPRSRPPALPLPSGPRGRHLGVCRATAPPGRGLFRVDFGGLGRREGPPETGLGAEGGGSGVPRERVSRHPGCGGPVLCRVAQSSSAGLNLPVA